MTKAMRASLGTSLAALGLALAIPLAAIHAGPAIAASIAKKGNFKSPGGAYKSTGSAQLIKNDNGTYTLKFANFSVTPGPKLKVWAVRGNVTNTASVKRAKYIDLGKLKKNKGAQAYSVPKSAVTGGYDTIVIWCEPFGVLFASAKIK